MTFSLSNRAALQGLIVYAGFVVIFIFFSVVLGACMGSFLNAVALRTVDQRPWWGSERSRCASCG